MLIKLSREIIGLLLLIVVACQKEYPIDEYSDFKSQPVLSGFVSPQEGVTLYFRKTLSPSGGPQDYLITGANIFLTSRNNDTTTLTEELPGKYLGSYDFEDDQNFQVTGITIQGQEVQSHFLTIPSLPNFKVLLDSTSGQFIYFKSIIEVNPREKEWYWLRFSGDSLPNYLDLQDFQNYNLCEANTFTASNSMVFSTACSSQKILSLPFRAGYFDRNPLPQTLKFELTRIETTFVDYLLSIQDASDFDYLFVEPSAPASNLSNNIGYIATLNLADTIMILK
ncbi:MAG: DUF4249 family protein [Saprospiraceae bacterium]|nr:DUF4249 family protein [Saprospiraceae bacterium]